MASRLIHEYLQEYGTSLFNVSVYGLYTKAPTSETVDFVRVSGQRFWCMAYQGDAYGTLLREVAVPAGELAPAIGKLLGCGSEIYQRGLTAA
jgi:hypothetical protein